MGQLDIIFTIGRDTQTAGRRCNLRPFYLGEFVVERWYNDDMGRSTALKAVEVEGDVLKLLLDGLSYAEAGRKLGITAEAARKAYYRIVQRNQAEVDQQYRAALYLNMRRVERLAEVWYKRALDDWHASRVFKDMVELQLKLMEQGARVLPVGGDEHLDGLSDEELLRLIEEGRRVVEAKRADTEAED